MGKFKFIILLITLYSLNLTGETEVKVGIKYSEPWVMYDKNVSEESRKPKGFSIDLWNRISKDLGFKTKYIYFNSTTELIDATKSGEVDAGISAITITSDREKVIDFSNSMYELGLQVMINAEDASSNVLSIMAKEINKMVTVKSIILFLLFLFITIHIRWFIDRRDGVNSFNSRYSIGIKDAFWWGVTMLVTWETPQSKGMARVIDLLWHIVGIIAISILTAIVTAALTAKTIGSSINSEKDLIGKYVAAVATDAPRRYLERIGANVIPVKTLDEGIEMLKEGKVKALVHDGPRLSYIANRVNKREKRRVLALLPFRFYPQSYAIVLPTDSPLREEYK